MSREAMKQALEAFEAIPEEIEGYLPESCTDAVIALRQALEQPADEPVANASTWFALVMNAAAELEDASHCLRDEDAKRTAISGAKHYRDAANAFYTRPQPAREWVGLTDDEYKQLHLEMGPVYYYQDYGHAIEAKLKEKNT